MYWGNYMDFTKMEATGNDFIVIDAHGEQKSWSPLAKKMCDRHFGIGADGLLLLLPSEVADYRMQIFNADGSEAEMCGNGLRCIVKFAFEHVIGGSELRDLIIETGAGIREAHPSVWGGAVTSVRLGMGIPGMSVEDMILSSHQDVTIINETVPLSCKLRVGDRELCLNLVSMGNPHAVCFIEESVDEFPLSLIGPLVETHPLFPARINFEIANVLSPGKIKARVWERGVGETLSCGTGACAIAVAAQLCCRADNKINIMLPGGVLTIEWDGVSEVMLTGPAREVFRGEWED